MTIDSYQGATTVRLMQPEAHDRSCTVMLGSHPDRSIIALAVCLQKADMNDLVQNIRNISEREMPV